jgi:hypothetical protein
VFDFTTLDVAIGLIFVFFVLSIVCSAINEFVASMLRWRPSMLGEGIENLLSGTTNVTAEGRALARSVHEHPLIQGMIKPGSHRWPSYIPSRTFVSALLSLGTLPGTVASAERSIQESIDTIPSQHVRDALTGLLSRAGGDVRRFEALAEEWFDDAMERVSGWYRRKVQIALTVIAVVVVLALNVDTVQMASHLWSDNSIRRAVVASASATPATAGQSSDCRTPGACLEDVANSVGQLDSLDIPLGWTGANSPDWGDWTWYPSKLLGLVLTVAALSLGAPFWFDVLSKVARLRASGAPPPTTDAVRVGEGEEKRAGPTATAAPEEPH